MTRLFLLSAALGFAAAISVAACAPKGHCVSAASSGNFTIGTPINFSDAPPDVSGGTLRVDLGSGRIVLTYPDGDYSVDFVVTTGANGGEGGTQ